MSNNKFATYLLTSIKLEIFIFFIHIFIVLLDKNFLFIKLDISIKSAICRRWLNISKPKSLKYQIIRVQKAVEITPFALTHQTFPFLSTPMKC